jgi:hypothetical protein
VPSDAGLCRCISAIYARPVFVGERKEEPSQAVQIGHRAGVCAGDSS